MLAYLVFGVIFLAGSWSLESNDNDSFCCSIVPKPVTKYIYEIKPVLRTKNETKLYSGWVPCDKSLDIIDTVAGKPLCLEKHYVNRTVEYYELAPARKAVHYRVPCPAEYLVCCEGYESYGQNCYTPEEIEKIKKLVALGLDFTI